MMSGTTWLTFLGASVALTLSPGPDNLFIISQGITRGRTVAVATAWGMVSGVTVHTLAAAFGISTVFYSSALAFDMVKTLGAAYLLYLAVLTWTTKSGSAAVKTGPPQTFLAGYRRGFLMNVLNPKVALFFAAFLPQFASPAAGSIASQMVFLGLVFMLQAGLLFTVIAWYAGKVGNWLMKVPSRGLFLHRLTALIFLALALRLALAERS